MTAASLKPVFILKDGEDEHKLFCPCQALGQACNTLWLGGSNFPDSPPHGTDKHFKASPLQGIAEDVFKPSVSLQVQWLNSNSYPLL